VSARLLDYVVCLTVIAFAIAGLVLWIVGAVTIARAIL
jgi:hypothetical protein